MILSFCQPDFAQIEGATARVGRQEADRSGSGTVSRPFKLKCPSRLIFSVAAVAALGIQGWLLGGCNRDLGSAKASFYRLAGIRYVVPCNSDKKIPISFCESRNLASPSVPRTDYGTPFRVEDISAKIPVGLPAALISSLLGATFYSKRLEKRAPETGQKRHSIPWPLQMRTALETLLLGVLLGALLAIAEVSLRQLIVGF